MERDKNLNWAPGRFYAPLLVHFKLSGMQSSNVELILGWSLISQSVIIWNINSLIRVWYIFYH